jgi:hypothetical protein
MMLPKLGIMYPGELPGRLKRLNQPCQGLKLSSSSGDQPQQQNFLLPFTRSRRKDQSLTELRNQVSGIVQIIKHGKHPNRLKKLGGS